MFGMLELLLGSAGLGKTSTYLEKVSNDLKEKKKVCVLSLERESSRYKDVDEQFLVVDFNDVIGKTFNSALTIVTFPDTWHLESRLYKGEGITDYDLTLDFFDHLFDKGFDSIYIDDGSSIFSNLLTSINGVGRIDFIFDRLSDLAVRNNVKVHVVAQHISQLVSVN